MVCHRISRTSEFMLLYTAEVRPAWLMGPMEKILYLNCCTLQAMRSDMQHDHIFYKRNILSPTPKSHPRQYPWVLWKNVFKLLCSSIYSIWYATLPYFITLDSAPSAHKSHPQSMTCKNIQAMQFNMPHGLILQNFIFLLLLPQVPSQGMGSMYTKLYLNYLHSSSHSIWYATWPYFTKC